MSDNAGATVTVGNTCFVDYMGHELTLTAHCQDIDGRPFLLTLSEFDVLRLVEHMNRAKDHLLWQSYPKEVMAGFTMRTEGEPC